MRTSAFGDSALLVSCAGTKEAAWQEAHRLADRLRAASPAGVHEVVPTYDSVLVEFDCTLTTHEDVAGAVASASTPPGDGDAAPSKHFRVPTVYGGEEGPDLDEVAAHLGLTPDEVIELHVASPLRIRCLTFPVASALLDGAAFPAQVPRRPTPRTTMADGTVMLAGRQTALSPLGAPTGWQLIGRTPCRVVDVAASDAAPYRAGDWLHFVPVDRDDWDALAGRPLEPVDG